MCTYWQRVDGLILIEVDFKKVDLSDDLRVEVATQVSARIKSRASEIDRNRNAGLIRDERTPWLKERLSFPKISVQPVKILAKSFDADKVFAADGDMLSLFSDNARVANLLAKPLGSRLTEPTSALFLLRRQFARNYERASAVKRLITEQHYPAILGKLRIHDYKPYLILYVLCSVILAFSLLWTRITEADGIYSFDTKELSLFLGAVFKNLLTLAIPFVAIVYFFVIVRKRRKTLKAIDKAVGVLTAGDIYCLVVHRIIETVPSAELEKIKALPKGTKAEPLCSDPGGFAGARGLLEEMRRIELEKLHSNKLKLFIIFVVALGPTLGLLKEKYPVVYGSITEGLVFWLN